MLITPTIHSDCVRGRRIHITTSVAKPAPMAPIPAIPPIAFQTAKPAADVPVLVGSKSFPLCNTVGMAVSREALQKQQT
ncbi:hypothetical protein QEZ63_08465 [Alcaligenes faecalis]|nr:hypothetical protein QEZ63_08465 [Alcaligenes faecalis]